MGNRSALDSDKSNGESGGSGSGTDILAGSSGTDRKEKVFSWFDVVRAGAQLTLDVLRVIRETSDLYRKISSGK